MDLLKIDHRTVNLDRLATIVEEVDEGQRRLTLVIGQDRVSLDEGQSDAFLAFVAANYRVRTLAPVLPCGARGDVEP